VLRVVFDTNIYISAILFGGIPQKLITHALQKQFQLFISPDIITEILSVLSKKFHFSETKVKTIELLLKDLAVIVYPKEIITLIKNHPADNRILECALAAKANCIVSGDKKHLLLLKKFRRIKIISVQAFLKVIH
jgi:putative PIN family toxin of toxin-antitoxin system